MTKDPAEWTWPRIARRNFLRLAGALAALTQVPRAQAEESPASPTTPAVPPAPERNLWTSAFEAKSVWGYVSRHSVASGEPFDVMLSTGPKRETVKGRLEFFRVGPPAPDGQKHIWTSPEITVEPRNISRSAAAAGANWPPTLTNVRTAKWATGYYSADFVHAGTDVRDMQVAQIVVRNPAPVPGRHVLFKLGTNTYQAYNAWGGHSLYPSEDEVQRGYMVSFDRPTPPDFFEYEVYMADWLEALGAQHGFTVDYATDFDVHHNPSMLDSYPLVITGCHDEYWSKEVFDAFERRIFTQGRNVIFLGGNTAYYQVRYVDVDRPPEGEDFGRQLVCYKSLNDPIARRRSTVPSDLLVTGLFRDGARRPETMLMGVAYQNWFSPEDEKRRYPYIVASTDAPFFEGTGYKVGDRVADVVGYEWDNRDPESDGDRLWEAGKSRIAAIPLESIKVLFRGETVDEDGQKGLAESVYFQSPAGAKVFSTGTVRWAWGLGKEGFEHEAFKRFNANLLLDFLR